MDAAAAPPPAQQKVMLGRDYEVLLPAVMTPRGGSVPLHPLNSRWALWAQKKVK